MLSLQSFLRKGVSLGYVGRNYNLKDLKDHLEYGERRFGFNRLQSTTAPQFRKSHQSTKAPLKELIAPKGLDERAFGWRVPRWFAYRVPRS